MYSCTPVVFLDYETGCSALQIFFVYFDFPVAVFLILVLSKQVALTSKDGGNDDKQSKGGAALWGKTRSF